NALQAYSDEQTPQQITTTPRPEHGVNCDKQETLQHFLKQTYESIDSHLPRLFIILPDKKKSDFKSKIPQFRLYFMCECSTNGTDLHLALHDGYIIRQSEQF
ncbi:unnamed protein product, partial [Didymodactylos carnosus]